MNSPDFVPPVVIVGNGVGAAAAAGFLISAGFPVLALSGKGSRALPLTPHFESSPWVELLQRLSLVPGAPEAGSFAFEFRNKSLRPPDWWVPGEAVDPKLPALDRMMVQGETARFSQTLAELEGEIQQALSDPERFANFQALEGVVLQKILIPEDSEWIQMTLSSGDVVSGLLVFAGSWSELSQIEGIGKIAPWKRKRKPTGLLQLILTHGHAIPAPRGEAISMLLQKEAKDREDRDKKFWGYFLSDGLKSVWSTEVTAEESEDNALIAKRLRKMKSALQRLFSQAGWLAPLSVESLQETVTDECVIFEGEALFTAGEEPTQFLNFQVAPGVFRLTDGYGPSSAVRQASRLSEELVRGYFAQGAAVASGSEAPATSSEESLPRQSEANAE